MINIQAPKAIALKKQDLIILTQYDENILNYPCLISEHPLPYLPVGTYIGPKYEKPILQIIKSSWSFWGKNPKQKIYWAKLLSDYTFDTLKYSCLFWKKGHSLAWITLSDKRAQGKRVDKSGPLIPELIQAALSISISQGFILPDDYFELKGLLCNLCFAQKFDLIFTTGGTGVTCRDITPDVCLSILDKRLPGFEQTMVANSLAKTPNAIISRATAGIVGETLLVNLPGSPKAVQENLNSILPALQHTLEKIHDDPKECSPS